MSNWSRHKKYCKLVVTSEKEVIATLQQQLADTKEQLAAKDRQIEQLIKRPRTVNNNTTNKYVVEQHIN
eukprot:4959293-Prymnesium_polylepis.1